MTLQEFKAWFEGFTECMVSQPNKEQWKRIKKRVSEIDGVVTTEKIFIDRYRYWPICTPPSPYVTWICNSGTSVPTYTSNTAMYSLGQSDAQASLTG